MDYIITSAIFKQTYPIYPESVDSRSPAPDAAPYTMVPQWCAAATAAAQRAIAPGAATPPCVARHMAQGLVEIDW